MRFLCFLLLLFFVFNAQGQAFYKFQNEEYVVEKIAYRNNDTIEYLRNLTSFHKEKPTLIFLQGSLPKPIIFYEKEKSWNIILSNFNAIPLLETFNLIFINRPFTPLSVEVSKLTNEFNYVPNLEKPDEFDIDYQRTNNLFYTSNRISYLIKRLCKNKTINKKYSIVLLGHSQGADEAVKVGSINKEVTDIVFLSSSVSGQFQDYLVEIGISYHDDEISFEQYIHLRDEYIDWFKKACENPNEIKKRGDSNLNVISFSDESSKLLATFKGNIYCGFGTNDIAFLRSNDIAIECLKNNKNNFTIKHYKDLEHNFFKVNTDGSVDYEYEGWNQVINDISDWYKEYHKK